MSQRIGGYLYRWVSGIYFSPLGMKAIPGQVNEYRRTKVGPSSDRLESRFVSDAYILMLSSNKHGRYVANCQLHHSVEEVLRPCDESMSLELFNKGTT
eukprot:scaffold22734_cov74-Skeletonema_menzelii.AAC.1